jgi:hypothetical protein
MSETSSPNASDEFAHQIESVLEFGDVDQLLTLQTEMYSLFILFLILNSHQQLQQSNLTLQSFNEFSATIYTTLAKEYTNNTKILKDMKKDLSSIFKKLR